MVINVASKRKYAPIDRVKTFFGMENAEPDGRGYYKIECPVHETHHKGAAFWETPNGHVWYHCMHDSGCTRAEFAEAIGMTEADLSAKGYKPVAHINRAPVTVVELAMHYHIPWDVLFNLGVSDGYKYNGRELVRIAYYTQTGEEYTKIKVRTGLTGHDSIYIKETPGNQIPYGLERLDEARKAGYLIIHEGESDRWTFACHGIPSLGLPGANSAKCLEPADLEDIDRIYIIQEPDQVKAAASLTKAGQGFYANVFKRLSDVFTGEIYYIDFKQATGYKDPNELHQALAKAKNIRQFVPTMEAAMASAVIGNPAPEPDMSSIIADRDMWRARAKMLDEILAEKDEVLEENNQLRAHLAEYQENTDCTNCSHKDSQITRLKELHDYDDKYIMQLQNKLNWQERVLASDGLEAATKNVAIAMQQICEGKGDSYAPVYRAEVARRTGLKEQAAGRHMQAAVDWGLFSGYRTEEEAIVPDARLGSRKITKKVLNVVPTALLNRPEDWERQDGKQHGGYGRRCKNCGEEGSLRVVPHTVCLHCGHEDVFYPDDALLALNSVPADKTTEVHDEHQSPSDDLEEGIKTSITDVHHELQSKPVPWDTPCDRCGGIETIWHPDDPTMRVCACYIKTKSAA